MTAPRVAIKLPLADADPRLNTLAVALKRFERRFRLQEAVALIPLAISVSLGVAALIAIYERLTGQISWVELLAYGSALVAISLLGVFAYAFLRPRDPLSTALHADLTLGLDERLSTALEDAARPPARPTPALLALRDAQLDDALHSLGAVNSTRDLPLTLKRQRFLSSGVLALVLLAVIFFPRFSSAPVQDITPEQVATEQRNIEILKEAIERSPNAEDPALQKLLQELEALSHDLKESDLTREEALARLSQTEAELHKALDPQASAQREAMEGLAEQLSGAQDPNLRRAGEALENSDPQKAAQELEKLANNVDSMTPEQRKALAQALREARDRVAGLDPELASRLEEAASALESGDSEAARQALNNLSDKVQQTGQNLATQKQIEQSLAQIQASKENIANNNQATPMGRGTAIAGTPGANSTPGTPGSGTPAANGTAMAAGSPISGSPVARATGTLTSVTIVGTARPGGTSTSGTPVAVPGQGQGQGQNQGQGQGQGQGQAQGQGQGNNAGPPAGGWGKGHQEPVYVPSSSVQATLTPIGVQGQDNPGGEQSTAPTNTDANSTGPSVVPYEQVYGEYREQAGTSLDSDYIPQGYKDLVRDYFSEIEPR